MAPVAKHKLKFLREIAILKDVHKEDVKLRGGSLGFPSLLHCEMNKKGYMIVMELLGSSLKDIRERTA